MKAIQTANSKGGNSRFSLKNNYSVKLISNINRTGLFSAFTFLLLALTCLFPISKGEQNTEAVTGTAQSSSLTLNVSSAAASVEFDVNSTDGTFASSSSANSAAFSVVTNNFSGYTLSISGSDNDGKLYDTTKKYFLEPLTSAVSEADFSSTSSLNGKWGYKPSKFNSAANANYLPAPTTTASTLDTTSVANTTANNYTISLGLRADYGTAANTYTNAFVITAVPNPIAYVITYDANTTDTVSNIPAAQNSTTSATSINLSNTTPSRSNYLFQGWCSVKPTTSNGVDSCSGKTYQPNAVYGIDKTTENITTLYAMWKINNVTVSFTAGTGGSVNRTSLSVPYGSAVPTSSNNVTINGTTTTGTANTGYSFSSWTNNCGTTVTKACTITANFSLNSYTITFTSNTGGSVNRTSQSVPYGSSISTSNNKITVNGTTTTATASTGYSFSSWTNNCGTTMPAKSCTVTANFTKNSYTVTFASNTGGTVNRTSQSVPYGTAISVSGNSVTTNGVATTATASSGYIFKDWTNGCGSTMPANDCIITATWNKVEPMQTYTASQCQANASSQAVTLEDSRDGKSYRTRYINGVCTMIDNLAIGKGQAMTPSNTNIASNWTMPQTDLTTGDNSYTQAEIHEGSGDQGNWYNYCAATAGTICTSSNSTNATYDICPKGWRLPTHDEQTSIAGSTGWSTTNVTAFNAVAAGFYYNGSLYNSGSYGLWWSSTAVDASLRYYLRYATSSGLFSGSNYGRSLGLSVRCVLK